MREQNLEGENQHLRVAMQQLQLSADQAKRRLAFLEREHRIASMDNQLLHYQNNNHNNNNNDNNDLMTTNSIGSVRKLNASSNNNNHNNVFVSSPNIGNFNSNNQNNNRNVEINHLFSNDRKQQRSRTPTMSSSNSSTAANLGLQRKPFRIL